MKTLFMLSLTGSLTVASACFGVEHAWEIRGSFETLRSGAPPIVVLRLSDGRKVEIPLDALTAASQEAVREDAAARSGIGTASGVAVWDASGRNIRVDVPDIIKAVEADAIQCRTAALATDVYRLYLAGDRLTSEQRAAAEARVRVWDEMSRDEFVRLGDRWVPIAEVSVAAAEAEKVIAHALELMRLGNAELAEDELLKASRLNPDSGRASFIAGLAYAMVAKKPEKAVEYFSSAVERKTCDAAALNNLAVVEVLARRHVAVARHFRQAVESAVDPMSVAENIAWAVKLSGDAKVDRTKMKYRMPDKTIDDLNSVYRALTQELRLKPSDAVVEPRYIGPDGGPCHAVTLADIATLFDGAPRDDAEACISLGFAVAPGCIVCPRQAITRADGSMFHEVTVESLQDRGNRISATVVAAPKDGVVALLRCDGLAVKPLSFADEMPPDSRIFAIDRLGESWLMPRLAAALGTIIAPADHGRFVHTAVVPRGTGGGPIIDGAGRVVGMVAMTPRTDASGNAAGFGIPVEQIRALLSEHAPDARASGDDACEDASGAGALAMASTVVVVATTSKPQPSVTEPSAPP